MVKTSFQSISEEWLEWISPNLKTSSKVRYMNILKIHLLPEFGNKNIKDISWEDAIAFRNKLLYTGGKKGNGLSPKTVSNILAVFKNIISYATNIKCIEIKELGKIPVKLPQKHLRVFSLEEQQRLNHYLRTNLNLVNLGILLTLYTGLRVGELCALRWEDISLKDQDIFVHHTLQRIQTFQEGAKTTIIITEPKSQSSVRHIPIPDSLIKLLIEYEQPGSCFFLTGRSNEFIEPRTMENRFNAVTRKCNISGSSFHTCRHTFATRCVELGFEIKSLSEILGHSNVKITMNRYVHPSREFKLENMNRLSSLFDN